MFRRDDLRYELIVLGLWMLAVVPTYMLFKNSGSFAFLGPLYFLCMLGTVYIVHHVRRNNR